MELTRGQEQGLRIALDRYRHQEPYTVIGGYAGSGKSSVVSVIIAALGIDPSLVSYISYTGRAAQVLRAHGCPKAVTAHKFLYDFRQKKDGTFIRIPKFDLGECELVVVDEISMLPMDMWNLLLSHGVHVLALGDPGQLPPIGSDNGVLDHPHVFLDEIMRQAKESEIIRLTMDIREGKTIRPFKGKEVNVVPESELSIGMMLWADQILCGKNNTRFHLNDLYRHEKWGTDYSDMPLVGDKLICLRNNWKKTDGCGEPLVNGMTGTLGEFKTTPNEHLEQAMEMEFYPDDSEGCYHKVLTDWKLLTKHEQTVTRANFAKVPRNLHPELFDYGYVITGHKSQGSQWPKVLVIEEYLRGSKADHIRWLYTACTRPEEKLTLVIKE